LPELAGSHDRLLDEHTREIGKLWVTRTKAALVASGRPETGTVAATRNKGTDTEKIADERVAS
jgi:hypothetical protein